MNIRKPIIPGRTLPGETAAPDSNPLRRLRDSQHFSRPTSVPPRPPSGGGVTDSSESPNTPRTNGSVPSARLNTTESSKSNKPDISNPKPLPPRVPLKPSTINLKPRERKHPLDISEPIPVLQKDNNSVQKQQLEVDTFASKTRVKSHSGSSGSDLNTTRDSEDSVFTSSSEPDHGRLTSARESSLSSEVSRRFPGVFTAESQFSVKNVDASADEMGLSDSGDHFWTEKVCSNM